MNISLLDCLQPSLLPWPLRKRVSSLPTPTLLTCTLRLLQQQSCLLLWLGITWLHPEECHTQSQGIKGPCCEGQAGPRLQLPLRCKRGVDRARRACLQACPSGVFTPQASLPCRLMFLSSSGETRLSYSCVSRCRGRHVKQCQCPLPK